MVLCYSWSIHFDRMPLLVCFFPSMVLVATIQRLAATTTLWVSGPQSSHFTWWPCRKCPAAKVLVKDRCKYGTVCQNDAYHPILESGIYHDLFMMLNTQSCYLPVALNTEMTAKKTLFMYEAVLVAALRQGTPRSGLQKSSTVQRIDHSDATKTENNWFETTARRLSAGPRVSGSTPAARFTSPPGDGRNLSARTSPLTCRRRASEKQHWTEDLALQRSTVPYIRRGVCFIVSVCQGYRSVSTWSVTSCSFSTDRFDVTALALRRWSVTEYEDSAAASIKLCFAISLDPHWHWRIEILMA